MPQLIWHLLPALAAAALAFAMTPLVARLALMVGAVDMPGDRKIHTVPTPRLGGLAVVASIAIVLPGLSQFSNIQFPANLAQGLALGILPVLLISLLDDIKTVAARVKLVAHVLGAIIAVNFGVTLDPVVHLFGTPIHIGPLAAPLSVMWIVVVTNAFNIIDGLDGLSVGLALIASASMAAVFFLVGQSAMGGVLLVLAGALAGFLPYNVHPARLFLGDTGATAIGFCLAAFALKGGSTLSSGFAALLPVFIMGLPIADTVITMARRLLRGVGGVFTADSNHIHHRLLALGVDHRTAVLILYAAGLVMALAAFLSVFLTAREAGLFVVALLLAGVVGVHRLGYDEFAFIKRGTMLRLYAFPGLERGLFVVFIDIVLTIAASYFAVGLKTDQWSSSGVRPNVLDLATTFAPVTVLVFWWSGMYRGSWRVAGLQDVTRTCKAVGLTTVFGTILVEWVSPDAHPLSLFVIYAFVSLIATVSLRASYVILENSRLRATNKGAPVIIYGAGSRGVAAVRELFSHPLTKLRPIGFIDDDASMHGKLISDLPVYGGEQQLESILRDEKARALLITTESIPAHRLNRVTAVCQKASVNVLRLQVRMERLAGEHTESSESGVPTSPSLSGREAIATVARPGVEFCPSCAFQGLHRSKARTALESLRKRYTPKRVYRCPQCSWRGWLLPIEKTIEGEAAAWPDLAAIDTALVIENRGSDAIDLTFELVDIKKGNVI